MFALAPDSQDPDCLHKLARNSVCICIHILPLHHFLVPPFASSPIPAPLSCQQPWYRITQGHHPVDKSIAAEVQGMSWIHTVCIYGDKCMYGSTLIVTMHIYTYAVHIYTHTVHIYTVLYWMLYVCTRTVPICKGVVSVCVCLSVCTKVAALMCQAKFRDGSPSQNELKE